MIFLLIFLDRNDISSSLEQLGLLGDFIGGVLGLIVAIASLAVTVIIAVTIKNSDLLNTQKTIEAQHNLYLKQIKYNAVQNFRNNCDSAANDFFRPESDGRDAARSIQEGIGRLWLSFPELEGNTEVLSVYNHMNEYGLQRHSLIQDIRKGKESWRFKQKLMSQKIEAYQSYGRLTMFLSEWSFK